MRSPIFGLITLMMARISGRGVSYSPPLNQALPILRKLGLVEMRQFVLLFLRTEAQAVDQLQGVAQIILATGTCFRFR